MVVNSFLLFKTAYHESSFVSENLSLFAYLQFEHPLPFQGLSSGSEIVLFPCRVVLNGLELTIEGLLPVVPVGTLSGLPR
jgi:hypothetical protein